MRKNFEVNHEEKKVIVKVGKLTDEEMAIVKQYKDLFGYEIVPYVEPKKEKKETKPEWKAEAIQEWLKKNGTEEQNKKYWELFNGQAKDENGIPLVYKYNVYKKDNKNKLVYDDNGNKILLHKKGEPRKKGHIATLYWFKKEFKEYPNK